ncbi:MAG: relaxase [Pseudomonadota bacterium]
MILKASQRGRAKNLGLHLLKTEENEHVELHEITGFVAEDVVGAFREAEAISKGTKCRQFLFSVSLNPPQQESVAPEVFEGAVAKIEERTGLIGQPRVIVFHEKEGRRHCHAVWSRIDADTMTAKPLPFFKTKLREISKELYLENGWQMPRGLMDSRARDPKNFTLAEWQQAKRAGMHAGELKGMIQECWAVSDTKAAFTHALEERGLYLAKGDRRGHVALTFEGEVISIPRAVGKKAKEVQERFGPPKDLPSVAETRTRIAQYILPQMQGHLAEARANARRETDDLEQRRAALAKANALERERLDAAQRARFEQDAKDRAQRLNRGIKGLWQRLTGKRRAIEKQNEMEAFWALQRDRQQRHGLVRAQLQERKRLQDDIRKARDRHAAIIRGLHHDRTNYRLMIRGAEPRPRDSFDRTAPERTVATSKPKTQRTAERPEDTMQAPLDRLRAKKPAQRERADTMEERLKRLRDRGRDRSDGPNFER